MIDWLKAQTAPRHMVEAVRLIGTQERQGDDHNPVILEWARSLPGGEIFTTDEVAWCGLFVAHCYRVAGRGSEIPHQWYRALRWALTGGLCGGGQKFGDVLVFGRAGGHHVGFYVGEDGQAFHVLGGNQNNQVQISRLLKSRLIASRRPLYKQAPPNVRRVELSRSGATLSSSEA